MLPCPSGQAWSQEEFLKSAKFNLRSAKPFGDGSFILHRTPASRIDAPFYEAGLSKVMHDLHSADMVAVACGIPLKIAAKVDNADRDYFEAQIRPLLDSPLIEYLGEIGDHEKSNFLSGAMALLATIDWPERCAGARRGT